MVQNSQSKERDFFLSPTLFNIFIKRIMSVALEEYDGKDSISSRNIIDLQFADDIESAAEEEQEKKP